MSDLPRDLPDPIEPVDPDEEQPAIPLPPPSTDNAHVQGGDAVDE